jgi:glycosyltransferase involved in cell wall biosynthesis
VSNSQKNLLLRNGAISPSKVHVIYNPLPKITDDILEVQGDDFGYFGGPNYLKGFQVLCKAATLVKNIKSVTIHATKFSGFNNQGGFLNDVGILTYGRLDPVSYKNLYKKIRTVVIPSVWEEPLPYVVSEALVNGRIVIASRVGGILEQVAGCDGAFLFDVGDCKQLAERILYVENLSQGNKHELGFKNRECIIKRFDNEKIMAVFSDLIMRVAK